MFWRANAASHLLSLHKLHPRLPSSLWPASLMPFLLLLLSSVCPFCLKAHFIPAPPPLPFPFLSSAAVLFSLFLSSFTSMASGSWVKRCRTEPTGGLAYLTAGSNELQHILASGQMWGWLLEGGSFWHLDGTANQTPRRECHECAMMKASFHFSLMSNLCTLQFIAQHNPLY